MLHVPASQETVPYLACNAAIRSKRDLDVRLRGAIPGHYSEDYQRIRACSVRHGLHVRKGPAQASKQLRLDGGQRLARATLSLGVSGCRALDRDTPWVLLKCQVGLRRRP
jgi:hypothetical protein